MKQAQSIAICALLITATASGNAPAHRSQRDSGGHHGGARIGLHIGVPLLAAPFHPYPFYSHRYSAHPYYDHPHYSFQHYSQRYYGQQYYGHRYGAGEYGDHAPSTMTIGPLVEHKVYVEQGSAAARGPASDGYWYYCHKPEGYYPSVAQCSGSWQRIASAPAPR